MIKIGIIDYGVGNVTSLSKSLRYIGFKPLISSDIKTLETTDLIFLPGVGSFNYAMEKLKITNLDEFIIHQSQLNRPIIGICLGMQLLTESSEESKCEKGLCIIPGKIKKLKNSNFNIGWNNIEVCKDVNFMKKFDKHEFFFNHGYAFEGSGKYFLSKTRYNNNLFASSIIKKNTIGFQFHPEKSQKVGLQLLKSTINFLVKNK
ncbi:imidazole glycerol phosphate synthase subunit HisH [Amylibacter sp.]|nr:imidazole glycerol phosphate synthase subunit HisH [Amylibacter sp.]